MKSFFMSALAALSLYATSIAADQPVRSANDKHSLTMSTYLITGLHCPPCTRTVESSLVRVEGIHSVKVDWKSKNAQVEFDEAVIPAQKISTLIAATPHMMGGNLHYGGWLALKVSEVDSDTSAKPVEAVLEKIAGVAHTTAYPKQHSVAVQFSGKGDVTSDQLISALTKAGFHAANM